jgi:Fe-S cluster assembly protein SufD
MVDKTTVSNNYLSQIEKLSIHEGSYPLFSRISNSLNYFKSNGLPSKKTLNWSKTNPLSRFQTKQVSPNSNSDQLSGTKDDTNLNLIVNNGIANLKQSNLPDGITVTNIKREEVSEEIVKNFFSDEDIDSCESLNNISLSNLILVEVNQEKNLEEPIIIQHKTSISEDLIISPTICILAKKQSSAIFIESFSSKSNHLINSVIKFKLLSNSNIEHIIINKDLETHLSLTKAYVDTDAAFKSFVSSSNSSLIRNNIEVNLMAPGASTKVNGLFNLKDNQHCDNYSNIKHLSEHTISEQLYKGIMDDSSHGCFTGKILIEKQAQKCSANQLNKNILLSKKAHIDTSPQLEVYADDVKCAHGASIGQISEDQLFYLQARGIDEARANLILSEAFSQDAIDQIDSNSAKEILANNFMD